MSAHYIALAFDASHQGESEGMPRYLEDPTSRVEDIRSAVDRACVDAVYNSPDSGKRDLIKRIESRNGIHTLEAAEALKIGTREYEIINIHGAEK